MSWFVPLFGSGDAKLQPVFVDDVAKAIETIIINKLIGNHIFELVGPEVFTYRNLYLHLGTTKLMPFKTSG